MLIENAVKQEYDSVNAAYENAANCLTKESGMAYGESLRAFAATVRDYFAETQTFDSERDRLLKVVFQEIKAIRRSPYNFDNYIANKVVTDIVSELFSLTGIQN